LTAAAARLKPLSETWTLDAQVLLAHVLGKPRSWVMAHPEARLSEDKAQSFQEALQRLAAGTPLPYLIGRREFYGLDFEVNPSVLIPRPETEHLVEAALQWLKEHPARRKAADVGTGSGCIAVTLAKSCADLRLLALDVSWGALQTARRNARNHAVQGRIAFVQADLLAPVRERFDLLCANLPYGSRAHLPPAPPAAVEGEPRLAMQGGEDGLDLIRRFLRTAPACVAAGGLVLLEIEAFQGEAMRRLARQHFPGAGVEVRRDLAGLDRLVVVQTAG